MGLFKTESSENDGGLTALTGFHRRFMKVFRTKRVDNSLGAFPRAEESVLFVKLPTTMPRGEDQEVTTTSFDMSSYECALAVENMYGEDNDARFINTEELDSDDVHLLSKSSETTKKSRRFRGNFRCSLKHFKKRWKIAKMLPRWKKDSCGDYTDAAEYTEGTEESFLRSESKWRIRGSFSDWAGRIMSSSNSAEHITHNNASSNEASISSSDFDTKSSKSIPSQFFPATDGGLGLFTML